MNPQFMAQLFGGMGGLQPPAPHFAVAGSSAPSQDALMGLMMGMAAAAQRAPAAPRRSRPVASEDDEDDESDRPPTRRRIPQAVISQQKAREMELKLETKSRELQEAQEELSELKSTNKVVTQERKEARTRCTKLERALAVAEARIKDLELGPSPRTPVPRSASPISCIPPPQTSVPTKSAPPKTLPIYEDACGSVVVARMMYVPGAKVRDIFSTAQVDIYMADDDEDWILIKADPRAEYDLSWKLVQRVSAPAKAAASAACSCCGSFRCRGADEPGKPCGGCFLKNAAACGTGRRDEPPPVCAFAPSFDWSEVHAQVFRDCHRGSETRVIKYTAQMSILSAVRHPVGDGESYPIKVQKGAQRRILWLVRVAAVDGTDLAWASSGGVPDALQWAVLTRHLRDSWGLETEVTVAGAAAAASMRQEAVWKGELARALKDYTEYYDNNMTGPHRLWTSASSADHVASSPIASASISSAPIASASAPVAAAPAPRIVSASANPSNAFAAAAAAAAAAARAAAVQ